MDLSDQVTAVGTPQTVTRDSAQTVLSGLVVQVPGTYSWELTGSMLLDYDNATGLFLYVWGLLGTEQPFDFAPIGAAGVTFSGTCIVDGFELGEVNAGATATSKFTWPVQGLMTATPPGGLVRAGSSK
jgi:hypothetical protein